jgi:hypothetical protein
MEQYRDRREVAEERAMMSEQLFALLLLTALIALGAAVVLNLLHG